MSVIERMASISKEDPELLEQALQNQIIYDKIKDVSDAVLFAFFAGVIQGRRVSGQYQGYDMEGLALKVASLAAKEEW